MNSAKVSPAESSNGPLSKLMFYLDCMSKIIALDKIPNIGRLTDYKQHAKLTEPEIDDVLFLSTLLNPELLKGKCIAEDPELCQEAEYNFIGKNEAPNLKDEAVLVGIQMYEVRKYLVYKQKFITDNYFQPLQQYQDRMRSTSFQFAAQRFLVSNQPNPATAPYSNQPNPGLAPVLNQPNPAVVPNFNQPNPATTIVVIDPPDSPESNEEVDAEDVGTCCIVCAVVCIVCTYILRCLDCLLSYL